MSDGLLDHPAARALPRIAGRLRQAPQRTRGPDLVALAVRRVVPALLLAGVLGLLARRAAQPLSNGDTFFHLRFGSEFLSGSWSLRHPGSVTALGTADWVPTQWLPQVVMAQLEAWFGLAAVAWFSGLQFVFLAVCLYLAARRFADPLVASVLVLAAVVASSSGLSMRPQVVSYALVAVTAVVWLSARSSGRTPWLLVPLTWVWATYHGMWPVGIVIGVAAVVGICLDGDARGRRLLQHLAVPVLSAAAAAATPVGPQLYAAVLTVSSRGEYFSEWGPPQLTSPSGLSLLLVLGLTTVVMSRGDPSSWTSTILLLLAGGLAVASARTVPLAAALATPVAAAALQSLIGAPVVPRRREGGAVVVAALGVLAVLALVTPRTASEPAARPDWVDPTLAAMPAGTRVISNWEYAGYVMWAYPALDPVTNGYGDIYTDAELERNRAILRLEPGWDDLVRSTGARVALVGSDAPLAYALEQQGWTAEQREDTVTYLLAPPTW